MSRPARLRVRSAIRRRPIRMCRSSAAESAQRCSNEWKPPGVISGPGGPFGAVSPFIQAMYALPSKLGIVGSSRRQAADRPQSSPVPRGPKSHLWQPVANRSQPSSTGDVSSTPNACTPSDAEQYALPLGPIPVRRMHDGGDLVEGQLHPRRRVDPRHSEAASSRGQRTSDRVDDAPARRRRRIVVEADESNRGAASGRRRPERDMGGVEIVLRRDDLVAGTQAQPAIHQPKTHRRAVGQRDLVR